MGTLVIGIIAISFLAVIFASGYNDKPKTNS